MNAGLRDLFEEILGQIESSTRGSIGSISNTYLPLISVDQVKSWRERLDKQESTMESKEPVPHSLTPALEAVLAELKHQTELMRGISSVLTRLADILDK